MATRRTTKASAIGTASRRAGWLLGALWLTACDGDARISSQAPSDGDELAPPRVDPLAPVRIELEVGIVGEGELFLGTTSLGRGAEFTVVVEREDCFDLGGYPLGEDDAVDQLFAESAGIPGEFRHFCSADWTPTWEGLERQQVLWKRPDGALDSFMLFAFREPVSERIRGFVLRARRGSFATLSAGKHGMGQAVFSDEAVWMHYELCEFNLGAEDYAAALLEEHAGSRWWSPE